MISKNNALELKKLYDFNEEYDMGTSLGPVPNNLNGSLVCDVKQMMLSNKNVQIFLKRIETWLEKEENEEDFTFKENNKVEGLSEKTFDHFSLNETTQTQEEIKVKSGFYEESNKLLTEDKYEEED